MSSGGKRQYSLNRVNKKSIQAKSMRIIMRDLISHLGAVMLVITFAGTVSAVTGWYNTDLPDDTQFLSQSEIAGKLEGSGTHSVQNTSHHFDNTFSSSEPVDLTLESVPGIGIIHTEPSTNAITAQLYINDSSGGDCNDKIGTWDNATKTCTLDRNLNQTVQIDSNNIYLEGGGHNITGPGTGLGIYLPGVSGITIKNLNVYYFSDGIHLENSSNNSFIDNNFSFNHRGLYIVDGSNNTIINNNASANEDAGFFLSHSNNSILDNNNASNNGYNGGTGGIALAGSNNILINNTAMNNSIAGISLSYSNNNSLIGNTAIKNLLSGIVIQNSRNNALINNNASHNGVMGSIFSYMDGIILFESSNNTLSFNSLQNNSFAGIGLGVGSNNNTVSGNNASNNYGGIYLTDSNYNIISSNNVSNNTIGGIGLRESKNNIIRNNIASNNYVKGSEQAEMAGYSSGIFLGHSNNNSISNNLASYNYGAGSGPFTQTGSGCGVSLFASNYNILDNNTANGNSGSGSAAGDNVTVDAYAYGYGCGFNLTRSGNNLIIGNIAMNNYGQGRAQSYNGSSYGYGYGYGIIINYSRNNTVTGNILSNNTGSAEANFSYSNGLGLYMNSSSYNLIYDNFFNNTNNTLIDNASYNNTWNTTLTPGANIAGGPNRGGNFWGYPNGSGFSQTCTDADRDGICDNPYQLNDNNTDLLPLTTNTDKIAPATAINLSAAKGSDGWYISDVQITLNATDNEGGSGVENIEYSFNDGWRTYTGPIIINSEGTTIIHYRSTYKAGNVEINRDMAINIDKTPPEAVVRFDNASKDINLYDNETGIPVNYTVLSTGRCEENNEEDDDEYGCVLRQYNLYDQANNSLSVLLQYYKEENDIEAEITSVQYNNAEIMNVSINCVYAYFSANKKGKIKELEQELEAENSFNIEAEYTASLNSTEIAVEIPEQEEKKETRTGMVALELLTYRGNLTYRY